MIKNTISGRVYIGSTVNKTTRRKVHFSHMRCQKHKNRRLQKDFNRYGESCFQFSVLCEAKDKETALKFEQIFIDGFKNTYNILPKAGKALGRIHIKTTKDKMSAKAKGRVLSEEQKEKLRTMQLGRKASEETKRKRAFTMQRKKENGEINHHRTLNEWQVLAILEAVDQGFDRGFLAESFGISKSNISHIILGATWKETFAKYQQDRAKEASA
jgi:group I intron endonuclease